MMRSMFALLLLAVAMPQAARADYRYGHDARTLRCESVNQRDRYCPADTRGGVRLVDQFSRDDCVLGRTWGYDRGGIWVAHGCRARFEIGGRDAGYGYGRPDYRPDYGDRGYGNAYGRQPRIVRCESRDDRQGFCRVPGGLREAEIRRRFSDARCDYGRSWGFQRDGIWVDRGCRAEFVVY